jgi:predicted TIM-barrel fold metal-dependent hydrolase
LTDLLIIDADGHINEPGSELRRRMAPEYRDFEPAPVAGLHCWDRYLGGTVGKMIDRDPRVQLKDMDSEGIDVPVIFPSGLSLSSWKNGGAAAEHARVYNDWLAEFCSAGPKRLKGVAQVALQDVRGAIKEVRRAVEDLGHVAVMMPTNVLDQDIGERQFWPFYEEVQGLGVALAVHGGINASERMFGRFNRSFIHVHTVAFPFECIIPFVIQRVGADKLLYASDYPHWDSSWPNTVKTFLAREDLSDADKRLILGENPQRLYGFTAEIASGAAPTVA